MKQFVIAALIGLSGVVVSGCSGTGESSSVADESGSQASESTAQTVIPLLQAWEALPIELEQLEASDAVPAGLPSAWQETKQARTEPALKSLIAMIRSNDAAALATVKSDVVDHYLASFEAVGSEIKKEKSEGTLDAKVAEVWQHISEVAGTAPSDAEESERLGRYCCIYSSFFQPDKSTFLCKDFHTLKAWAFTKCQALQAGVAGQAAPWGYLASGRCSSQYQCK